MSQYSHLSQPAKTEFDDDLLESLQNIPSNFDLALNGARNRTNLWPNQRKEADASLLDPEAFRRLSISTISSMGLHSRGVSPFPDAVIEPKSWRTVLKAFWNRNGGLLLVAISQLFGALMNVTTRLLELEGEGMNPFQVLFARMFLTTAFCCTWMWWKKTPDFPLGMKPIRLLLVARGLSGFFGIFGMYCKHISQIAVILSVLTSTDSLQYLPVADAVVLTFLAPSVASYGCYLFLKEPFSRSAQYASLISLIGVVLIARPTSFFSTASSQSPEFTEVPVYNATNPEPVDASFPIPTSAQRLSAVAVAMLGVFGSAGAFTTIRWIGPRAHPLISVNYFAVWCTIVSTAALTLSKPMGLSSTLAFALPAGFRQWSMLLFLGVCGFFAQFLLTKGLAAGGRDNGARATNMVYTNMLFALALDKLIFGQSPGWWSLGGSGLILGSAMFVALQQQQGGAQERDADEEVGVANRGGIEEEEMRMLGGGLQDDEEDEVEIEEERGRT